MTRSFTYFGAPGTYDDEGDFGETEGHFNAGTAFDDLEDEAFWADAPSENLIPLAERAAAEAPEIAMVGGATYTERCAKCRGTGHWRPGYPCFACKGAGSKTFRTSPQERSAGRAKSAGQRHAAQVAKARIIAEKRAAWIEANKAGYEFLLAAANRAKPFALAEDLLGKIAQYGDLSPAQTALVERLRAESAEREVKWAAERAAKAVGFRCEIGKITEAMERASAKGVKAPRMVLQPFKLTRMQDGSLRVTHTERTEFSEKWGRDQAQWLGKIVGGVFQPGRNCRPGEAEKLVAECARLQAAESLTAFGQQVGYCCACGAELTVKESIERAMGPICFAKYG